VAAGDAGVTLDRAGDQLRLRIAGEVDVSNVAELRAAADTAGRASVVVVDLAECTFLDSSALAVLARYLPLAERGELSLRLEGARPLVRRVLEITGFGPHVADT
jgi:anti-anti-sigma factor